ncbi:hypothetical protein SAMN00777080_3522 [Aquiflexum balticum DSM 16537]|uniref:Uncharacterized protein n=1 Tax=Aquiflexum balticum DSM 16537 TaxID=758820 RepID=A0A1W2H8H4_9BACT|nr:hypothetical protein [Aquiflexum balticum]SMD44886.1 hypothetical protein SAMN00777080_3522 [Aquiflexum balticum DSM 16537]
MLLASAKRNLALFFFTLIVWGCQQNDSSIQIKQSENRIEINNSKVKAIFEKKDGLVSQTFFAKKKNEWKEVVSGFIPPKEFPKDAVQLFNQDLVDFRYLSNSNLNSIFLEESKSQAKVTLMGQKGSVPIEQVITLSEENDFFHFSVKLNLEGSPAKLDYALTSFTFNIDHAPEFVHTPGLKFDNDDSKQNRFKLLPGKDQIIGDRAYHAPAIIVQEGGLFAAIVPDLNAINKHQIISPDARRTSDIPTNRFSIPIEDDKYTMPTGLDLNIMTGLTNKPVMTFGYMDNVIAHHIRYQRVNDSSMIRTLDSNELQYEFDLFVSSDAPENKGFQRIPRHQWEKFGKPVFDNRPHLAMPFKEYFNIIDSITFNPIHYENISIDTPLDGYENTGSWLEWEENGVKMGGYRSAIEWWNDVLHNSAFWNNAREAQGFWYWGNELGRPDLIEKGRNIINWSLSAPRNENGLFALLYSANDKKWGLGFTDPVNNKNIFFLKESDSYDVSTMSKTAAHLVDYHLRCEKDKRIIDYLTPYSNWLVKNIDERGAVPSYVDQRDGIASPILHYSAQSASSMWFLAEMYVATGNDDYLDGAKQIAKFLEKEILPEQKWVDMEQFFSCGHRPFEFERDRWQNQVARGNLSLFWAIEGFAALYRATQDQHILDMGEQCVDYVTFTQACWEPHYIYTAFPFGGFGVDNADNATFLDARQAEMVRPFIWYGKTLGRQDLVERGVAAARSSVVLINHPRHKSNNIYRHTNIYPFGLGPENIDHEAHPQSAMRTHPSWGEGSGIFTGLAEAGRALGGVYIDFENEIYVGVDGIQVEKAELIGDEIHLTLNNSLADLTEPWNKVYSTNLIVKGLKQSIYQLKINGSKDGIIFNDSGLEIPLTVQGDEFSF